MDKYDFGGWATRNDLLCSDGRTIKKDAFKNQDGMTVPIVWNHDHNSMNAVLGHAVLENREDGVYAYGVFNNTKEGQQAKELVKHGDVRSLSIYANKLKHAGSNVVHGIIKELSLVLAGANPGATIDWAIAHGDGEDDAFVANYDVAGLVLYHSDDKTEKEKTVEDVKFENIASNTWVLSMPESMPMVKDFRFYMCIAKADGVPSGLTYITLSISNLRITKITDGSSITGIIKSTNYVEDSNGDCISGMMTNYSSGEIRTPNGRWDDDGLNINQLNATGGKIGAWVLDDGALYSERTGVFDGTKYTTMVKLSPLRTISDGEATLADYQYPIQIMEKGEVLFGISETGNIENKGLATLAGRWRFNAGRITSKIGLSMGAGGAGLILCDEDGKPVIWIQDENSKLTFRVDRDGTMYHNDNVLGEVITKNVGAKSMSSGTWTDTGASVTLPAGKYVVNGTVLFNSAANGQRGARFATSSTDYFRESQQMNIAGTTKGVTSVQCSYIANLKTSTKLNLQGIQSSGAALSTINSYIQAIRIA